jgi:hypothetical protein
MVDNYKYAELKDNVSDSSSLEKEDLSTTTTTNTMVAADEERKEGKVGNHYVVV